MTEVSPEHFLDAITAYQKTAAVLAAVDIDVFTSLSKHPMDAPALAAATGANERGLRILCDTLTAHGFLIKKGSQYELTPSSRVFLDRGSPTCLASLAHFLAGPDLISTFLSSPAEFVRKGGSLDTASIDPNSQRWVAFAESMAPMMAPIAAAAAQSAAHWSYPPRKVLDIAAGHGLYGIAFAKAFPNASVVALDWQNVLAVAQQNATAAGVAERFHLLPGNAFEVDWGTDFDVILMPNFLHHFDFEDCVSLLAKARRSLSSHGRVLVIDFVPNEDRVSPTMPATFAFVMLASTPRGDAYTASEYKEMAQRAGFSDAKVSPIAPSPLSMILMER